MQTVVIDRAGSYKALRLETRADPPCPPGHIAIDVLGAGVNYADCVARMGLYASAKKYVGWPLTPGFEVAGTVAAGSRGGASFPDGMPVVAVTRFGGYASHLCVPRQQVFPLPRGWDLMDAAGFPTAFLTAWYALCHLARPRPKETLLVHSAAGGVGGALVQIGKLLGCRVIGVVGSSHKVEYVRSLGADAVIDKSTESLWRMVERLAPDGCDVVLDANGAETLGHSWQHLAPAGRLVVYGFHSMLPRQGGRPNWLRLAWQWLRTPRFNPLEMTTTNRSVLAFNLSFLFDRMDVLCEAMDWLLARAAEGRLKPAPTTILPMAQVAEAHRRLESGETLGKIVLATRDM